VTHLRDVLGVKVDNGTNEVLFHDVASNRLPLNIPLPQQGADSLEGELDGRWRVSEGSYFDQVLLLYSLDGYEGGGGGEGGGAAG